MSRWRDRSAGVSGRRRPAIFVVTALGAFMASLDLSIVNVAFPALERSFPHDSQGALAWVITGYSIVFASLLVTAGRTADRLGRRRAVLRRPGRLHPRIGAVRTGSVGEPSRRRAARPGRRCRGDAALVPGAAPRRLPHRAPLPGRRPVGRGRRPGRRDRSVARGGLISAGRDGAGRSSSTCPSAPWPTSWVGGCSRRPVRPARGRGPTTSASCSSASRSPPWCWPSRRARAGAGRVGGSWPASSLRPSSGQRFCTGRPGTSPSPCWTCRSSRRGPSAWPTRRHLLYAMGFFAMLLGNILFLTSVWHYSILRAGLAVTPGPLVVAAVSGPAGRLATRVGFRTRPPGGHDLLRRRARLVRHPHRPAPRRT